MAIDEILNARKTQLSGTYLAADTTLTLQNMVFGDATKDFRLIIFDRTQGDVADARAASRWEICLADYDTISGNDVDVSRAQEGTTAIDFDGSGIWVVICAPTKATFDQIIAYIDAHINDTDDPHGTRVYNYDPQSSNYNYDPATHGYEVENTSGSPITATIPTGLTKSVLFVQSGAGAHNISADTGVIIEGPAVTDGQKTALLLMPSPTTNEYWSYLVEAPTS